MTGEVLKRRLDDVIAEMRGVFRVPSIMAAVTIGGETFYCGGGSADIEAGKAADENTVYAIASASKAFIAAAVCILADDGCISLDEPVKKYLPDFAMYDGYMTDHMTMRDAMSHRTGLPRHDLTWYSRPDLTIMDTVRILRYMPPAFEPRTRMHYQNHMFTLATVLVESVSGMKWYDFVSERILHPLGMNRTFCLPEQFLGKDDNTAIPYKLKEDKICKVPFLDISSSVGCAGCICSTVHDLAIWARLNAGRGSLNGVRIYSEARAADLHTPQMIIKPGEMTPMHFDEVTHTAYGLGWFIESYRGHTLVHHGGTIDGYKSLVGFLPGKDVSFAVLTNLNGNQTPAAIGYAICDLALDLEPLNWCSKMHDEVERLARLSADRRSALMERTKGAIPFAHSLSDYCGKYENPAYGTAQLFEKDGSLHMTLGRMESAVIPAGYESFVVELGSSDAVPCMFRASFEGEIIGFGAKLEEKLSDYIEFTRVNQ